MWADGSSYEGNFVEKKIHGKGRYQWSDGRVFIGEWENNLMSGNGIGVFLFPSGKKYEG